MVFSFWVVGSIWSDYGGLWVAIVVGGGAAIACWVMMVVGETGKENGNGRKRVWGRRSLLVCGCGRFWLRKEKAESYFLRKEKAESWFCIYRGLEKFYVAWKSFFFLHLSSYFFNIMLMWKIVKTSEVSILYIY